MWYVVCIKMVMISCTCTPNLSSATVNFGNSEKGEHFFFLMADEFSYYRGCMCRQLRSTGKTEECCRSHWMNDIHNAHLNTPLHENRYHFIFDKKKSFFLNSSIPIYDGGLKKKVAISSNSNALSYTEAYFVKEHFDSKSNSTCLWYNKLCSAIYQISYQNTKRMNLKTAFQFYLQNERHLKCNLSDTMKK